jgi:hypothetical protein
MPGSFILNRINSAPANTLFFNRDFLNFHTRGAVDMFLLRLFRKGFLKRLARGIYVRYDCTRKFSIQELAEAKAKRFGRSIALHAAESAARLKFIERGNHSRVFFSQGSTTSFESTAGVIGFKAMTPRRVALKDLKIVGENISALWWLKKRGAREHHIHQTLATMNRVEREDFLWSHDLMPGWLSDLVHAARGGKIVFPLGRPPRPQS